MLSVIMKYIIILSLLSTNLLYGATNENINVAIEKYFTKLKGSCVPYLIEVIKDGAKPVKIAAIRRLGNLKSQKAIKVLTAVMCYVWDPDKYEQNFLSKKSMAPDFDEDVRAEAALSLGKIGDKKSLPLIGNTLLSDRNSKVKQYCAKALGLLRDKDGIKYLQKAIKYELALDKTKIDNDVVREAVKALGSIGDKEAFFILIEVTQSNKLKYETKKEALKSLEKIKWE